MFSIKHAACCVAGLLMLCVLPAQATVELKVGVGQTYSTIQAAIDALPRQLTEQYVINIAPGMYPEKVRITGIKTTPTCTLTLIGHDASDTIIDAGGKLDNAIEIFKQSYVVVEHLTLRGAKQFGNLFLNQSHHCVVRHCILRNAVQFDGICLSGSTHNSLTHNVLYANNRAGIFLGNTSRENTIAFNLVVANRNGLQMHKQYPSDPIFNNHNAFHAQKLADCLDMKIGTQSLSVDPQIESVETLKLKDTSPVIRWGVHGQATEQSPQPRLESTSAAVVGDFFFVDLNGVANRALKDDKAADGEGGWTDQGDYDLRHLPLGKQVFGDTTFQLPEALNTPGVIALRGKHHPHFPEKAGEIRVGQMASSLTFLHTLAWSIGDLVMTYHVKYEDGRTLDIPIHIHGQINDWWDPKPADEASVAWAAKHPQHPKLNLGVYSYTWSNPYPFLPISSIDIQSAGSATPMVLAITGHKPASDEQISINLFAEHEQAVACSQTIVLKADCMARQPGQAQMQLQVFDEQDRMVYQSAKMDYALDTGVGPSQVFYYQPPVQKQSQVYRVAVTLRQNQQVAAQAHLFIEVLGTQRLITRLPHLPTPATQGTDQLSLLYGCEIQPLKRVRKGQAPPYIDASIFDQLKVNGGNVAHLVLWWSYLEPKPDAYDFSCIDWALAQCRRVGLKASISVWMADHVVPDFVADENMLDQFGKPFLASRGRTMGRSVMPSLWGPKTNEHYTKLIQAICRKYIDDPTVTAWAYLYQHVEVTIHDRTGTPPILYDYSEFSQQAYRRYLKQTRGWNLDQLNQRYGTTYTDWQQVRQPVPVDQLDVSLCWSDFQDFRIASIRHAFELTFKAVRQVDSQGRKTLFTFNPYYAEDILQEYNVVADYTGSESPYQLDRFLSRQVLGRLPIMVEPTKIPPDPAVLSAGFFNALSVSSIGYLWVGTKEHGFATDTPAADMFRRWRDAWTELADGKPQNASLAILRSEDTALADEKVIFNFPRYWLGTQYDWLINRLQQEQISYQPIYDTLIQTNDGQWLAQPYQLIIDTNSVVMREVLMQQLIEQVRQGATLILQPQSGRYLREDPTQAVGLLSRLGWQNVQSLWQQDAQAGQVIDSPPDGSLLGGLAIRFLNRYPIDQLQGGMLMRNATGQPVANVMKLGEGQVVLLAGEVDWQDISAGLWLTRLRDRVGITEPLTCDSRHVRTRLVHKANLTYLMLQNRRSTQAVQARIQIHLPSGTYKMVLVTDAFVKADDVHVKASQIANLSVNLMPNEFRVYRLEPGE
jgi:parallel beta-helix repeat protein